MSNNTSRQEANAFLHRHHTGVLSTISEHNRPWGAAIYFAVDDDFNIFFVTRKETYKGKNLEAHPYAALTVVDEATQTTVQASGKVSKVPVDQYVEVVFNKLAAIQLKDDINWAPPIMKVHEGDYIPLQLTPDKLQYAVFSELKNDIHDDYIHKII